MAEGIHEMEEPVLATVGFVEFWAYTEANR